jgi:hypothetical protein
MSEYHKIQTVFKRDPAAKYRTLLEGDYSLPEFEYLANNKWVFTEKVNGTNIRVYCRGGKVTFGGRTDRAQIPATLIERLNERFLPQVERFSEVCNGADVRLYGEGHGAKIQKDGGNYRHDQDFVLFDVLVGDGWLQRPDVEDVAGKLGLDVVPVVGAGTLLEMVEQAKAGVQSTWGDFQAEGYVARPAMELRAGGGHRLITKIKCRDFVYR